VIPKTARHPSPSKGATMTKRVYIQVKADDLRTGNKFVEWALNTEGVYGPGRRILDVHAVKSGLLSIKLDDMSKFQLRPGQLVVIEELA
jgi:hypothetical protein